MDNRARALAQLRKQLSTALAVARIDKTMLAGRARLGRTVVSQAFSLNADAPSARTVTLLARALGLDEGPLLDLLETAVGAERDSPLTDTQEIPHGAVPPDMVPPPTGWLARSGYVEHVRHLFAPAVGLLDRDAELEALISFCASDAPYQWWQAGPYAGKTALLSTFVLNPPDGVDVVSFFVNARDPAQANHRALVAIVNDQLRGILGEHPSPEDVSLVGSRYWGRLKAAAQRSHDTGRQLVLVVDGLDEDLGAAPGSSGESVAAWLPKAPIQGLKVIVASRPDPPILGRLHDHPLNTCQVRVLAQSPHAREIAERAREELDRLLKMKTGKRFRNILGLVVAAGGGLSTADMLHLTGLAPDQLDGMLAGAFGRTIARGADPTRLEPHPILLFTHAALVTEAAQRLGSAHLQRRRNAIHTWANTYRERRWPDDTPDYLLSRYPLMLSNQRQDDRLGSLILDPDYLTRAGTQQLLQVLDHAPHEALPMARLYRRVAHHLEASGPPTRAAILHSAAVRETPTLAPGLTFAVRPAWTTLWSDGTMATHQVLTGQKDPQVLSTVNAPDGRPLLAAGGTDGIRIWDAATGLQVGWLAGHTNGPVTALAFFVTDNRVLLASAGYDDVVRVWDTATGEQTAELTGHNEYPTGLVWIPADTGLPILVSGSMDGTLRWWDIKTAQAYHVIRADHSGLTALTAVTLADDLLVVSAGRSTDIGLWEANTGTDAGKLVGHTKSVRSLATCRSAAGHVVLASGADDGTVRFWEVADRVDAFRIDLQRQVKPLVVFPLNDGRTVFATIMGWHDSSRQIGLYDTTGVLVTTLNSHAKGINALTALAMPDGRLLLASAASDDRVLLWNLTDPDLLATASPEPRADEPITVTDSTFGLAVITGSRDGALRYRDLTTGTLLATQPAHDSPIRAVFSTSWRGGEHGDQVVVTVCAAGGDQGVRIWNPATAHPLGTYRSPSPGFCTKPAFFTDHHGRFVMANNGGDVIQGPLVLRMLDLDRREEWTVGLRAGSSLTAITATTLHNGDRIVALGDRDGAVWLWNVATTEVQHLATIQTLFYGVHDLEFLHLSEDRTWLIASAAAIHIWNIFTDRQIRIFGQDPYGVVGLTSTRLPDGRPLLISGSKTGSVRIWNPVGGQLLLTIPTDDMATYVAASGPLIAVSAARGMSVIDISASLLPAPTI